MRVVRSLTHWGREMKKVFNLKRVSGSKKMNKGTCLYAVAQRVQEEDVKMEHWPGTGGTRWFVLWLQCWGKAELG